MKAIRSFEEFIGTNIVKKQSPDRPRAEFLIKESERDYSFLKELAEKMGVKDDNANLFVKSCYDILMQMIRARMLVEGYNASGQGAHESEVAYMRVLGFSERDVQFADQIRYFRNGMLYYGTRIDSEYAGRVMEFTKRIYPVLKKLSEGI